MEHATWEGSVDGIPVRVIQASIVELGFPVDAIVSSDDNRLTHGGSVSAAIWSAAGAELDDHVRRDRPVLQIGSIWVSPAFKAPADHIVHAITIDLDQYRRARPFEITQLYGAVLETALESRWKSVAFPLIGGAGGRNAEVSTASFVKAVRNVALTHIGQELPAIYVAAPGDLFEPLKGSFSSEDRTDAASTGSESKNWAAVATAGAVAGTLVVPGIGTVVGGALGGVMMGTLGWLYRRRGRSVHTGPVTAGAAVDALPAPPDMADPVGLFGYLLHRLASPPRGVAKGATVDEEPPRLPIREAVPEAFSVEAVSGRAFSGEEKSTLTEAAAASERILNGTSSGADDVRAVFHAIDLLNQRLNERQPGSGLESLAAAARTIPTTPRPPTSEAPKGQSHPPAQSRTTPAATPTQPVVKLLAILKSHLQDRNRKRLLKTLEGRGYRGSDETRLLEYCLQEENLCALLMRHFSIEDLQLVIQEEVGAPPLPTSSHEDLALQLLEMLGFPAEPSTRGLLAFQHQLVDFEHSLDGLTVAELLHRSLELTAQLERLLKLLIRFLCQWLLEDSPEPALHARGWLEKSFTLERCTLGRLVEICGRFDEELARSTSTRLVELRKELADRSMLPAGAEDLPTLRNEMVHRRAKGRSLSDDELLERGRAFASVVRQVVEHLQAPHGRVFPFVVRVERITIDRYGRRLIEATSDGEPGKPSESIFTDDDLRGGELYLMRPLSNPLRVRPVLVPAGDLGRTRVPATSGAGAEDGA